MENGIWLCQKCAKLIDSDETKYAVELLKQWKLRREAAALEEVGGTRLAQKSLPFSLAVPTKLGIGETIGAHTLHFAERFIEVRGRERESDLLQGFADPGSNPATVCWWLMLGKAGAGKSRLALELVDGLRETWNAGFLSEFRRDSFHDWVPEEPTLIVVDYAFAAQWSSDLGDFICSLWERRDTIRQPVRLLLLDRGTEGSWMNDFLHKESIRKNGIIAESQYATPLTLTTLSHDTSLEIIESVIGKFGLTLDQDDVRDRLLAFSPANGCHPLTLQMTAVELASETAIGAGHWNVVDAFVTREEERWRVALPEPRRLERFSNLVLFTTLLGGCHRSVGEHSHEEYSRLADESILPRATDIGLYPDIVAMPHAEQDDLVLSPLEPDMLGEFFALRRLVDSAPGRPLAAHKVVQATWRIDAVRVSEFIRRAFLDFPEHPGIEALVESVQEASDADNRWATLVADLIAITPSSENSACRRAIDRLRASGYTSAAIRHEHANAELRLGLALLRDESLDDAYRQFEAALSLAHDSPDITAKAILDRGVVNHCRRDRDSARADYQRVMRLEGVANETKACALNNLGDIAREDEDLNRAIKYYSKVLPLDGTSYNRRYIALSRRARCYAGRGEHDKCFDDLATLLETIDIAMEQKAHARFLRAEVLEQANDLEGALSEYEAICGTRVLFEGDRERATVGKEKVLAKLRS